MLTDVVGPGRRLLATPARLGNVIGQDLTPNAQPMRPTGKPATFSHLRMRHSVYQEEMEGHKKPSVAPANPPPSSRDLPLLPLGFMLRFRWRFRVMSHPLNVDGHHRFITYDPRVVTRWEQRNIPGPEVHLAAVIHDDMDTP